MAGKNNNFSSALLAFLFNRTTGSWGNIFADPSGALSKFYIALHTANPTAAAANQTVNGVRVSWKMVPAVRETRRRQSPHRQTRPFISQETTHPQCGQTKPSGHRSQSR